MIPLDEDDDKNHPPKKNDVAAYMIDMIAQLRMCLVGLCGTFEDLTLRFLDSISKGYRRVDIIADTYRDHSIKAGERKKRGSSSKVIIGSIKSKLPPDLSNFMLNNDNKSTLIEMIFEYIMVNKEKALQILCAEQIFLSGDNNTFIVTSSMTQQDPILTSNQEEADTKLILHSIHVLNSHREEKIVLRNPSGDTDILVLALGLIEESDFERVFYDSGSGKNRKQAWLKNFDLDPKHKKALVGFHAFTGNDYVSGFFRKGKKNCWNTMVKNKVYVEEFEKLGDSYELNEEMVAVFEDYVCRMYGVKKGITTVDEARMDIFTKKHSMENKVIDLSLLPPCKSSLYLHLLRANFVSNMWKQTSDPMITLPEISTNGWFDTGDIQWITDEFPEEVTDVLMMSDGDSGEFSDEYGTDDETEEEVESDF